MSEVFDSPCHTPSPEPTTAPASPSDPAPSYCSQDPAITFDPELAHFVARVEAGNCGASPQSVQYVPHSPTPSVQEVSPPPLHVQINPPNEGYAPLSPGLAQTLIRLSEEEFIEVARTVAFGLAATVERRTNIAAQQIAEA
jgi:hypothetical protein